MGRNNGRSGTDRALAALADMMKSALTAVLATMLPLAALAQPQVAAAGAGAGFPCPPAVARAVPALGAPATIVVSQGAELGPSWQAPPCTGWAPGPVRLLISITNRFSGPASIDDILARAGAVSLLKSVRYWSISGRKWQPMLSSAEALAAADRKQKRGDFTAEELRSGRPLYSLLNDSGPASSAIFRTRVTGATATTVSLEMENSTIISMLGITLFNPGDIKTFGVIARQADGSWVNHSLVRIDGRANSFLQGDGGSYVNRAVAYMRHLAGTPTDAEPPPVR